MSTSLQLVPLLALLTGWCGTNALDRHVVLLPSDVGRQGFDTAGFCRRVEMALPAAVPGTLLGFPPVADTSRAAGWEPREERDEEEEEEDEDILDNGAKIVNLVDLGLVPDMEFFERYLGNHPIRWLQPVRTGRPPRAAKPQSGLSRLCRYVNRVPGLGAFCKRLTALAANNPLAPLLAVFNPGRRADENVLAVMLYPAEWRSSDSSSSTDSTPPVSICEMLLSAFAMSPPKAIVSLSSTALPQLGFGLSRDSSASLSYRRQPWPVLRKFYLPGEYFSRVRVCMDLDCVP